MSNQYETWAKGDAAIDANNVLWKQYATYVDLFKFYLDTALKANLWFYSITGAILTYYFAVKNARPDSPNVLNAAASPLEHTLVLPMVLGVGLGIIFLVGSTQANDMRNKLRYIRDELKLPGMPHVQVLIYFLALSGFLHLAVSICIYIFVYKA